MQMLKVSLLASLVLAVSACGGSGGGSSAQEQVQKAMNDLNQKLNQENNTSQQSQNNTETKPNVENQSAQSDNSFSQPALVTESENNITPETKLDNGVVIEQLQFEKGEIDNVDVQYGKISGYNRQYSFNGAWLEPEKAQDPSVLEVASKRLALMTQSKLGALGGLQGTALSKVFGIAYNWASSQAKSPESQMFYFGVETPVENIPTQGKVTYQGNATRYDNITQSLQNIGTSTLVADFDNKKISGKLDIRNDISNLVFRRDISLKETDIKGNGFEGRAVAGEGSLLINREGVYEGKFFGPNAEEVAGQTTFGVTEQQKQELKDLNTSFSAEQVK